MESENGKGENEMNVSTTNATDSITKSDDKETIEERYNKLRGFAVKLKKKVSDLSDQLQKSEAEKNRINEDKEELQNKIVQISENVKKLQSIQLEYDRIQDDLEQQKSENKKTVKNLESVITENASLKESLYTKKESIAHLTADVERLTKEQSRLEAGLKQSQELVKELKDERKAELVIREQKDKEYEEMKNTLNLEIEAHKVTQAQLDASKHECTTKSVLSLEVQNYEKSVEDLKGKLNDELSKRVTLEKTIEMHLDSISSLNSQVDELRATCLAKTNQITILGEKNEDIKQELCETKREAIETKKNMNELLEELKTFKQDKDKLIEEIERLTSERDRTNEEIMIQSETYTIQIKGLEAEISRLNAALTSSNEDLETLRTEFTGYKLRAQSVLRTKQSQSKEIGIGGRNVAEIEEELEHARTHSALLRDRLECYTERLETLTRELTVAKEERNHAVENQKECEQKLSTLHQELASLMEQLRCQTNKIQQMQLQHSEEIQTLQNLCKNDVSTLEEKYQQEIHDLQAKIEKVTFNGSVDHASVMSNVTADKHIESNFELDHHSRLTGMSLLEREEGEGSESVDTCPSVAANAEKCRKHTVVPLDELLNSSDNCYVPSGEALSLTESRQSIEVYERRIKHLTALLADSERDVAKLTQLNQLLKEDIRRQQRSVEREQHASNFEYLKNVVFKFVTLKNGDERNHLIPVLNTILKLSPEETQKLNAVAGVSGRSWIPGIPIPGWNNS